MHHSIHFQLLISTVGSEGEGDQCDPLFLCFYGHLALDVSRASRNKLQVRGRAPEQHVRGGFGEVHAPRLGRRLHARRRVDLKRGPKGQGGEGLRKDRKRLRIGWPREAISMRTELLDCEGGREGGLVGWRKGCASRAQKSATKGFQLYRSQIKPRTIAIYSRRASAAPCPRIRGSAAAGSR